MEVNEEYLAWHSQDQLLSTWIQASLSDSAMVLVVGLNNTKDIWNALETNFASQSQAKVMQFRLQLQTIKKEALVMKDYLNKIKACCDLLGAAGCRVMEQDQIIYILGGLGPEYDPVMVMITSKANSWTVQDVNALLLSFESRLEAARQSVAGSDGTQPSAYLAHTIGQRRDANHQNNRGGFEGRGHDGRRG